MRGWREGDFAAGEAGREWTKRDCTLGSTVEVDTEKSISSKGRHRIFVKSHDAEHNYLISKL